jgi:hypothetical protein
VSRFSRLLRAQLLAAPLSETSMPKCAFAITFTHGMGGRVRSGASLPSISSTYSAPPSAK